jgi:hypothetical protein
VISTGPARAVIRKVRRLDAATLRAALWALREATRVRAALARGELMNVAVSPPPRVPKRAQRGVRVVLERGSCTCLVRSLVWQAWLAAHGDRRDVVIGVSAPGQGFHAHAWLDGEAAHGGGFTELVRRPASG